MRAMNIAATGMQAQQTNVEVISNNIANMNTVGFKRQRAEFQDLLYQNVERMGAQSSSQGTVVPTGIQIGSGVKAGSVYRITEDPEFNHFAPADGFVLKDECEALLRDFFKNRRAGEKLAQF